MAKEVSGIIKLQIKGAAEGVNIMEFCKQFNGRTQDQAGKIIPVIITVYRDKSFDFIIKSPPVAVQLLEISKQKSGSTIESAMRMVAGTARSMGITVRGTPPFAEN